ncbi:cysteine dioxygenase [Streptomyces johnsoniae]|uniref:Cysteine dioxygenase family protein n=1 Tax=Streptomyces johnsoniae TaxID=3075532 RepID=A0ABU2SE91_9ACTN|nr:cysteine dioxygenase family protein [Streptomyces sp. DSM 41886]MDT0447202.1 cysteine dioxygenase family protein [Streptomyces sp. DSM 41886]
MSASAPAAIPSAQLARTVRRFAARTGLWRPLVRFTAPDRSYRRLERTDAYEVWLLTWLPGQGTEIHDHGGSAGSFGVVAGTLTEHAFPAPADGGRRLGTGDVRAFGPGYVHQVTNADERPAVSIHAYAPALTTQTYYRREADGRLAVVRTDTITD